MNKGRQKLVVALIVASIIMIIAAYYLLLNQSLAEKDNELQEYKDKEVAEKEATPAKETTDADTLDLKDIPLSEFQITACRAADRGGTCQSRLPRLNLVSAEECCKYLKKCC